MVNNIYSAANSSSVCSCLNSLPVMLGVRTSHCQRSWLCSFPTRSKSYLTFAGLIEYVRYLYRISICENSFKCKAFSVSILILKCDFNSIWILSFSCRYANAWMCKRKCTKNRRNQPPKCAITRKIVTNESQSNKKMSRRN